MDRPLVAATAAGASGAALASYPVQLLVCIAAAAAGALAFQLSTGQPLVRDVGDGKARRARGLIFAGALFGGVMAPAVAARLSLPNDWVWLVGVSFILGMAGHAVVPILPGLIAEIVTLVARGYAKIADRRLPGDPDR